MNYLIKIRDTTYTQNTNNKTVLFITHIFSIPYVPVLIKSVHFWHHKPVSKKRLPKS